MTTGTPDHEPEDADGIPMTGEEDPLAEVDQGVFSESVATFAESERDAGNDPAEGHDAGPDASDSKTGEER